MFRHMGVLEHINFNEVDTAIHKKGLDHALREMNSASSKQSAENCPKEMISSFFEQLDMVMKHVDATFRSHVYRQDCDIFFHEP